MSSEAEAGASTSPFKSPTFDKDISFTVDEAVGSASISPSGRDVVLASRHGLYIIDLDEPYNPPRHLPHSSPWEVADVQWSPFASRAYWVVSTSNQKALVWNLDMSQRGAPIEHVLHAHSRAITDINFAAHDPDVLATCGVDSFVHCWDLKAPQRPAITFANWFAGATQVKWNRQDENIIASSHETALHVWDKRKSSSPLVTIDAHATKIYGIDWNRLDPARILTCSLDGTIKLWDYTRADAVPMEIIRTPYPVWRARHTPFGEGILAMPQRGDFQLHLYSYGVERSDQNNDPVHSFRGHQQPVKEFLWRTRGDITNGADERDFQLVSWGMDRCLLLQSVNQDLLEQVGYIKGQAVDPRLSLTRSGATYKSYRNPKTEFQPTDRSTMSPNHVLSDLFRDAARSNTNSDSAKPGNAMETMRNQHSTTMRGGSPAMGTLNPMTWMKGVKISKAGSSLRKATPSIPDPRSPSGLRWEVPETLGDEIIYVGEKYKNVAFDRADMSARLVSFSLNGPWGVDDSLVHVKTTIHFPKSYPDSAPSSIKIEKTSSISDKTYSRLTHAMKTICESYASFGLPSFEQVVCYLVGERGLNESIAWLSEMNESMNASIDNTNVESSSDEEDGLGVAYSGFPTEDLEASDTGLGSATANANVPLPKACGALWSNDGRLICFFPPKGQTQPATDSVVLERGDRSSGSKHDFQSYGRFHLDSLLPRKLARNDSFTSEVNEDSTDLSSLSSSPSPTSSSRSSSPNTAGARDDKLPSIDTSRQLIKSRSIDFSQPSSAKTLLKPVAGNKRNIVSIHDLADMLPAKRSLAEEYIISGEGRTVCEHNAEIARKYGYHELADVWDLVALILYDEVPLELINMPRQHDVLPVMARRALVHIKRKDSGLDLSFDGPERVVNPAARSLVKWGEHPLAYTWLIERIFDYFEKIADTQTLAVIASVLVQVQSQTPRSFDIAPLMDNKNQSMNRRRPTLPSNYYPTIEVAVAMSKKVSQAGNTLKPPEPTSAVFGSLGSSSGAWGSDLAENDTAVVISGSATPPSMARQASRTSTNGPSLSSSPEQHFKRSNSTVGNALAVSFSKPFSFLQSASSSPPSQARLQAELSTSAPSSGSLGTLIRTRSKLSHEHSKSDSRASATSHLYDSDAEDEVAIADEPDDIFVSLKNQNLFDDEGYGATPLIQPLVTARYRAYRQAYSDLLDIWGLPLARCEILKLNGQETSTSGFSTFDRPMLNVFAEDGTGRDQKTLPTRSEELTCESHCQGCSQLLPVDSSGGGEQRCSRCSTSRSKKSCSVCAEAVSGLFKLCVNCGHLAHTDCLDAWHASTEGPASLECDAACGCLCSGFTNLQVELDDHHRQPQLLWQLTEQRSPVGNRYRSNTGGKSRGRR